MDEPKAVPGVSKGPFFNIWLVIPLRTVKFDEESIGDGFMTDGWT